MLESRDETCAAGPGRRDAPREWPLPDKYQFRRVIGTGGMGTVLLARDVNLDRLVAIKVLHTQCRHYLDRLRQEARWLARLEHPSIVRVHELDVHDHRLFLSMDYQRGGNLALARLDPHQLVRALRGVVDALAHAHAQGIVHRDVKPENVLLASAYPGGIGMLSDFGLACGPGEGNAALRRPIIGTPLTMSPEQTQGETVGPLSDVFSLGVTLYRKLTERWPFPGRTVDDVFQAIRSAEPQPLVGARGDVPRRLQSIVLKALRKEPRDRFASMDELGEALDRFLEGPRLLSFTRAFRSRTKPDASSPGPHIHPEDPA